MQQGAVSVRPGEPLAALRLMEVQSRNDGTWIDEFGETDDWVELLNAGDQPLQLADFWLTDGAGQSASLGAGELAAGRSAVVFADDDPEQGCGHLPFKLDSDGEQLVLQDSWGRVLDGVSVPALKGAEIYVRYGDSDWQMCPYASPGAANAASCVPPKAPSLQDNTHFESYQLPDNTFAPPQSLRLSALGLRPAPGQAAFVQLYNGGNSSVDLSGISLSVRAHAPGQVWPEQGEGLRISLGAEEIVPAGERRVVEVPVSVLNELAPLDEMEAVVSLFDSASGAALDRIDFMSWPEQSVLARQANDSLRLCYSAEETEPNQDWSSLCEALEQRPVGERLRHLLTAHDYSALARGATKVGIESVKFVHERQAPGLVHLLSAASFPLHYTFVRRRIYLSPNLDRCDVKQNDEFNIGWGYFSDLEYRQVEAKRFLLGTLSKYGAADLNAVEYTFGDSISASQMRQGFLEAVAHTQQPYSWSLRPQDERQVRAVRPLEGTTPLVAPNAPFQGLTYQTLSDGVGFGILRFVPAGELSTANLGPEVILITDSVPNDIPLVGGLVTEAFQTPLAHVNVLSQSRGTPNASLVDARTKWAEYLDRLVRLEVGPEGVAVSLAEQNEAQAYWQTLRSPSEPFVPRIDTSVRGPQDLAEHGLDSLPALGAKASQLSELMNASRYGCGGVRGYAVPEGAFALPVAHFLEHAEQSGALAALSEAEAQPEFNEQASSRSLVLAQVRELILQHPVEPDFLLAVEQEVAERFGQDRVRFRSSSNAEDLANFSGAGLYTSRGAQADNPDRAIADALRTVWASLYNQRAYDERRLANVAEGTVAMAVLIHRAFRNERANGVAISRNLLDPVRGDQYFINSQLGEASVTNPAPGVGTEQLVYRWYREPNIIAQSQSSLLAALGPDVQSVLTPQEVRAVACALSTVHLSFRPLLDPGREDPWFAMEVEFKFLGPERRLLLKQARPHSFGRAPAFSDCREF